MTTRLTRSDSPVSEQAGVVARILDQRLVRAQSQPVVHLESGRVAGCEAPARGPVGTWEIPCPPDLLDDTHEGPAPPHYAGALSARDCGCG